MLRLAGRVGRVVRRHTNQLPTAPTTTHVDAIAGNGRRCLSSYEYSYPATSHVRGADRRHQVAESMQNKTHRLLDSSATPLGSFNATTTDDIIAAVHYWTSSERPPAARLRSATIASRLVRRFTVEIAVNNLWACDRSSSVAELNSSLRKVWLQVEGKEGCEAAEAALRAETEEYFDNRSEVEPTVESFLTTAAKWLQLAQDVQDGEVELRTEAAERAAGILMYGFTECLEITEKDGQQRAQITNLFQDVYQQLEECGSDQLSVVEERMNQLRSEGWDRMLVGEHSGRISNSIGVENSIVSDGAARPTSDATSTESDASPSSPLEESLKHQFMKITEAADADSYKKVKAIYLRLLSMSDEPDSSFVLDQATAQHFADYLIRTRPADVDPKLIMDVFGAELIPNGSSSSIGDLMSLQLKSGDEEGMRAALETFCGAMEANGGETFNKDTLYSALLVALKTKSLVTVINACRAQGAVSMLYEPFAKALIEMGKSESNDYVRFQLLLAYNQDGFEPGADFIRSFLSNYISIRKDPLGANKILRKVFEMLYIKGRTTQAAPSECYGMLLSAMLASTDVNNSEAQDLFRRLMNLYKSTNDETLRPDPCSPIFYHYISTIPIRNGDPVQVEKAEEALCEMIDIMKAFPDMNNDEDLNWPKRCFDLVIKAHTSKRVGDKAVLERVCKLIDDMEQIGIKERGFATQTYLHAVASAKRPEVSIRSKAKDIFDRFRTSFKNGETGNDKQPNMHMFCNMMEILVKSKKGGEDMLTQVLDLCDEMKEYGLYLDHTRHNYAVIACTRGKIEDEHLRLRALQYTTDLLTQRQEEDCVNIDKGSKSVAISRMMEYGHLVHAFRFLLPGKGNVQKRNELIASAFKCCCRDGVLSEKNMEIFRKSVPPNVLGFDENKEKKKEWCRNVLF
mmetsp:Transcript_16159/g.46403  ORF Transcript_16159/g.46403 Transcript_16159/m.46403 type:complete len:912 (-) Transcript_16159:1488-4223(-)